MTAERFIDITKQLGELTECATAPVNGKGKTEKLANVNEHIKDLSAAILRSFLDDSNIIVYRENGRELVDIWSDRDNMWLALPYYGGYSNIPSERFLEKYKNALNFSRYEPNKNPNFLTYHDD
ncbi:MAG: hypothetical protein NC299_17435 [Lachnospiraceae bacterium]|nr:hypothetical protein [Ruminococcus sp.]MCM1277115.1 hypothetical protein [Lachnospiraceae bacterium]